MTTKNLCEKCKYFGKQELVKEKWEDGCHCGLKFSQKLCLKGFEIDDEHAVLKCNLFCKEE